MDEVDILSQYMAEACRHEILSREEEDRLARTYWTLRDGTEEERQEARAARETLIRHNLRLVVSQVARIRAVFPGLDFLESIQNGNLGLLRGVDKFNPELGFKVSTYVTWWIRQGITRGHENNGRSIRLPVHKYREVGVWNRRFLALAQKLGREPTLADMVAEYEYTEEKARKLAAAFEPIASLDAGTNGERDSLDPLEALPAPEPEEHLERIDQDGLRAALNLVFLQSVTPREAKVLRLRHGLDDGEPHTLEEVGKKYDLTRERIRQVERDALRKIRNPKISGRLKPYL